MEMKKLLESMHKFAGEPTQKSGDQVRGTEKAPKNVGFKNRLVGDSQENPGGEHTLATELRDEFEKFANKNRSDSIKEKKSCKTVNESRPTRIFDLINSIKQAEMVERVVDIRSQADGMTALVRTTDGNAYEMQIRPAEYAQHPSIKQKTLPRKSELNEEEIKIGDRVHIGHGVSGGTGVIGHVIKLDGDTVYVRQQDSGKTYKGSRANTTHAVDEFVAPTGKTAPSVAQPVAQPQPEEIIDNSEDTESSEQPNDTSTNDELKQLLIQLNRKI